MHRQSGEGSVLAWPAPAARPASWLWGSTTELSPQIDVLGLTCQNTTLDAAAHDLVAAAQARRPARVVFVNAHVVNEGRRRPDYWQTVATADRIYADGSGMAIAARAAGQRFIDNVNGTDLFPLLCTKAIASGQTIFLLGAKPGVAAGAAARLRKTELGPAIAGTHHGYFGFTPENEARVIDQINASGASILLVGFGVPLQDEWIRRNQHRLKAPVVVGVGGLFDFFSGRIPRAPEALRGRGLEWVWRLAQEPARMWRRYIIGNLPSWPRRRLDPARLPAVAADVQQPALAALTQNRRSTVRTLNRRSTGASTSGYCAVGAQMGT